MMTEKTSINWRSHAATHVGNVRQINEDSYLDRSDLHLWAIADGMGGHHAGDVASSSIVTALGEIKPRQRLSTYIDEIEDRLIGVNRRLRQMAAEHEDNRTIGSTVMAMVAKNDYFALLWAGDSRAYRSRNGNCEQLSKDHSQVEELIDRGVIMREDAESHPASNVITRAVGASEQLYVDVDIDQARPGDKFLLCSDGLYKHVSEAEIGDILKQDNLTTICQNLVDLTLKRGATDNVTIVVIQAEKQDS
ncbi:PP2C family protein-serine/threonine phosphatase [Kaarinaea lacus]